MEELFKEYENRIVPPRSTEDIIRDIEYDQKQYEIQGVEYFRQKLSKYPKIDVETFVNSQAKKNPKIKNELKKYKSMKKVEEKLCQLARQRVIQLKKEIEELQREIEEARETSLNQELLLSEQKQEDDN